jgi:hypothetical protein
VAVRSDAATDRVSYTASNPPDPASGGFTVLMWAYLSVDRDDFSTLYRMYTSAGSGRGQLATAVDGTTTAFFAGGELTSPHALTVGAWSRVALTIDGATATLYAAPSAGAVEVTAGPSSGTSAPNQITLGGISVGSAAEWWNGRLANVRVWAAALSQAELSAEWSSPTPVRTSGLWADWPLSTHTDLTDHSGNGRDLVAGATATTTEDGPPVTVPVPEATASLPLTIAVTGAAVVPPATVQAATATLPVTVGLSGAAVTPPATVPTATGHLPVLIGLSGAATDGNQHDVTLTAALAPQNSPTALLTDQHRTATLGGTMADWNINRLSVEHVPIDVADNGTPITGWRYIILPAYQPATNLDQFTGVPTELAGKLGVLIGPGTSHALDPGEHDVWVRYESTPEAPVIKASGRITITRGVNP